MPRQYQPKPLAPEGTPGREVVIDVKFRVDADEWQRRTGCTAGEVRGEVHLELEDMVKARGEAMPRITWVGGRTRH